jgi:MFS family permease
MWTALPETSSRRRDGRPWRFPPVGLRAAVPAGLAGTAVQAAFLLTLPLYLNRLLGWRETQATIALAALIALAAIVQVAFVARLMTTVRARHMGLAGFGLMLAGGLVLALASSAVPALLGAAIAVVGVAVLSPVVPTLIGLQNRSLGEGEVMGVNQAVASTGQMTGPLIGYGALQAFAIPGYGVVCAGVAAAGIVLTYAMRES